MEVCVMLPSHCVAIRGSRHARLDWRYARRSATSVRLSQSHQQPPTGTTTLACPQSEDTRVTLLEFARCCWRPVAINRESRRRRRLHTCGLCRCERTPSEPLTTQVARNARTSKLHRIKGVSIDYVHTKAHQPTASFIAALRRTQVLVWIHARISLSSQERES